MRLSRRKTCELLGLILVALAACGSRSSVAKAQAVSPSAEQILEKLIATYANASSYQDSGTVRLVKSDSFTPVEAGYRVNRISSQSEILITFKTRYLKPNQLRFEWSNVKEAGMTSVILYDGKTAYLWSDAQRGEPTFEMSRDKDLWFQTDQALSSALGANFFIPSLLLKEVSLSQFSTMLRLAQHVSVLRDDTIESEPCYLLRAEISGVPWLLWIDKKSFVLRKTRTVYSARRFDPSGSKSVDKSVVAEEIHTKIILNGRVPRRVFRNNRK